MVRVVFSVMLLLLCGIASAQAQTQIYNAPSQTNGQVNNEVLELLDEAPAPTETPTAPQTIEEFSNRYYANCLRQDHPILQGESLELMCGCTSAQIPQNMTLANINDMQGNTPEGQIQRSRMLLFVYTPCIEFPTKALVYDQCIGNKQVTETLNNDQKVCGCLADGMATFMRENAEEYISSALNRDVGDLDPLRFLLESTLFKEQTQYFMRTCVQTHELGIGR